MFAGMKEEIRPQKVRRKRILSPRPGVSTRRAREADSVRDCDDFADRGGKILHTCAWDNDGVAPPVRLLGDAQEFAAIVLAQLHLKMITDCP